MKNSIKHLIIATLVLFTFSSIVSATQKKSDDFHLTLWCEYPAYGNGNGLNDYFKILCNFIRARKINRVIFRVQDPKAFTIYKIGTDPEDINCGMFFRKLLMSSQFQKADCEVYVLPWINNKNQWGYPFTASASGLAGNISTEKWDSLNNIEKTVIWIQTANEYLKSQNCNLTINGIVYEQEGAGIWSDKRKALPSLKDALYKYLKAPSPQYSNDKNSKFKIASASQFNFDNAGTDVYIHETYPQFYNLTSGTDPIYIDATSAKTLINENICQPNFPNTIYTANVNNLNELINRFIFLKKPNPAIKRHENIHYMFSTELAHSLMYGHANKFHNRNMTITGATNTGTINAFGSPGYSWEKFTEFLKIFGKKYQTNNFAIFQFNMLPPSW